MCMGWVADGRMGLIQVIKVASKVKEQIDKNRITINCPKFSICSLNMSHPP